MKRLKAKGVGGHRSRTGAHGATFLPLGGGRRPEQFQARSSVIVANRVSDEIRDVMDKVYTRDLGRD